MTPFRHYDTSQPLVSLHVPKCAGTGLLRNFAALPQDRYRLLVYYPEIGEVLPSDWDSPRVIVHGHFQRFKGEEVEKICPTAKQFLTVLRDPLDVLVSAYYYGLRERLSWSMDMTIDRYLGWWFEQEQGPLEAGLPSREGAETLDVYISRFVCIGLLNRLPAFYEELSGVLGVNLPQPEVVNDTDYVFSNRKSRSLAEQRFAWDYALLDRVRKHWS